jgi:tetratricopeptide (TPR) repeat protein
VLPFENLSRQPGDEWLAGAFSDSLTLGLRDAENIVLVNREHLLEMNQSRNPDPAKMARALGVQYYVNGSYQRVGDTLKVVARLVEVDAGTIKLQESFTDQFANLLNLEDDLARRFSTALEGSAAAPKRISTTSLDAYRAVAEANDLYLAGRFREAVQRLDTVPQKERYADAWALLGKSYAQLSSPNYVARGTRSDLLDRALKASQRAIELEPSLYEAQIALATTYQQLGQVESWRIAVQKAIDLNPRLAEGYVVLGDSYALSPAFGCARKRDSDLAERSYRKALQLDPHFSAAYSRLISNLFWSGREDEALRTAEEALRLLPGNVNLLNARAGALIWLRKANELEKQVRQLETMAAPSVLEEWELAVVDLVRGKNQEAAEGFRHAIESGPVAHREIDTGRIYAEVGQAQQAAAHLQHAFELDSSCAGFVAESPEFRPYLNEPALRMLLARYQPAPR